jgi:5'-nucleotidase
MIFAPRLKTILFVTCCLMGLSPLIGQAAPELSPQEKLVTILGTNDIHGGIEARTSREGVKQGGLDFWAGAIRSIREGIRSQYGDERAGVLVVDGGDQFQGTLLSNFDEGKLVMQSLSQAGLDAAVPGNHDYDFGPLGWLIDKLPRDQKPHLSPESDPRGALMVAIEGVRFPLLSANTYIKSSLRDWDGVPLEVESKDCRVVNSENEPIFALSERPSFLKPYTILERAGLRIALIGLDHTATASMTTAENVSDLCFRNEVDTYLEVREELEGKADLFVLLVHGGNTPQNPELSNLIDALIVARPGKTDTLHAVVGGHTHQVHRDWVQGIPVIQSGSGGELFGRIDLIWNTSTHAVDIARTKAIAGIRLLHRGCAPNTEFQCREIPESRQPTFEGVPVSASEEIKHSIDRAAASLAPLSRQVLGFAETPLGRDRINESPMSNLLTDLFREVSLADITLLNTGGIRDSLSGGELTYGTFFKVLPFNNRAVIIRQFEASRLISLIEKSIRTCGEYGALMASGLRVEFMRNCAAVLGSSKAEGGKIDPNAKLVKVSLSPSGEVLFDSEKGGLLDPSRTLSVATLDFLAAGGSAYTEFVGAQPGEDTGILRELLADWLRAQKPKLKGSIDGRWLNRAAE